MKLQRYPRAEGLAMQENFAAAMRQHAKENGLVGKLPPSPCDGVSKIRRAKVSQTTRRIVDLFEATGKPMRTADVAEKLGVTTGTAASQISRLVAKGKLMKSEATGLRFYWELAA